jgi:hypothetical protein
MRNALTLLTLLGVYTQPALADTSESKPGETFALIALGISLAAIAYAGNKWRLWWFGFQIGDASGAEFLSAMKWSLIGLVVVAASIAIIGIFGS